MESNRKGYYQLISERPGLGLVWSVSHLSRYCQGEPSFSSIPVKEAGRLIISNIFILPSWEILPFYSIIAVFSGSLLEIISSLKTVTVRCQNPDLSIQPGRSLSLNANPGLGSGLLTVKRLFIDKNEYNLSFFLV